MPATALAQSRGKKPNIQRSGNEVEVQKLTFPVHLLLLLT